jgi:hypothetical protein
MLLVQGRAWANSRLRGFENLRAFARASFNGGKNPAKEGAPHERQGLLKQTRTVLFIFSVNVMEHIDKKKCKKDALGWATQSS